MVDITFSIPSNQVQRIIDAFVGLYPIPEDDDGNPIHTEQQHPRYIIRNWIIDQVVKYEKNILLRQTAGAYNRDETLIT